jgi:hypothetical protein
MCGTRRTQRGRHRPEVNNGGIRRVVQTVGHRHFLERYVTRSERAACDDPRRKRDDAGVYDK